MKYSSPTLLFIFFPKPDVYELLLDIYRIQSGTLPLAYQLQTGMLRSNVANTYLQQ